MESYESDTTKIETSACGKMYCTITYNEYGAHHRVFISGMGKAGNCFTALFQVIARLITYCFELGGSYMGISKQLKGIQCPEPFTVRGERYKSCIDALAAVFEEKREEADKKQNGN